MTASVLTAIWWWMNATICRRPSFELVARRAKARYVTGLSASTTRKDGHQPIIFMQCGPVRYRVNARQQAAPGLSLTMSWSAYGLPLPGQRSRRFTSRVPAALRGVDPGTRRNELIAGT